MRDVLSPKSRGDLKRFLLRPTLMAFDYDGTLAPLGRDPKRTPMRSSTEKLLRKLTQIYPCVVITGRSVASARGFLRGLGILTIVGNHGADSASASRRKGFKRKADAWEKLLKDELSDLAGVSIEHKGYSLSVHYRHARRKKYALARILLAAGNLTSCRIVPGIRVVNLIPFGAPNKASVLRKLRSRLGCRGAMFIGDDVTDEEVFGSEPKSRLFSVRVGKSLGSRAAYFLGRQSEIDRYLKLLVDLRVQASILG